MNEYTLHHQYQAWCQGLENPERDWSYFVEWAAKMNGAEQDDVMRILQRTYWFKRP